MTSGQLVSAGSGQTYYTKDDYYLDQKSVWWGRGRQGFEIDEEIELKDWKEACIGSIRGKKFNFHTGRQYDDGREYRAGFDLTFSAPKSVSVLAMRDQRWLHAHEIAVQKTLQYIQDNLAACRQTVNGQTRLYKADNILAGLHLHLTSRELQPHLHTHAVIMNTVLCPDGQRRSLRNDQIVANIKNMGMFYRSELARQALALDYGVVITDRAKGFWEVAGVRREILDYFSKRASQVKEAVARLKSDPEFRQKYPGISDTKIAQIAVTESRQPKQHLTQQEFIERNEQELEDNFGLNSKNLVEQARAMPKEPLKALLEPREAIREVVEALAENQVMFTREKVMSEAFKYDIGISIEALQKEFDRLSSNTAQEPNLLLNVGRDPKGRRLYTTHSYYRMNKDIVKAVKEGKSYNQIRIADRDIEQKIRRKEQQYSAGQDKPFQYTEQQKQLIRAALGDPDQFLKVQGDAGSGKTFAALPVTELLTEKGYKIKLIAPTGAAAKELSEATRIPAQTAAMFQRQGDIDSKTLLMVDESGMLSLKQMHQIVQAVKEKQAKCIWMGDVKQLKSIGAGESFKNLNFADIKQTELTEIRRQKTAPLKELVTHFKELAKPVADLDQNLINQKLQKVGECLFKYNFITKGDEEKLSALAVNACLYYRDQGHQSVIIARYNKGILELNNIIRSRLTRRGEVEPGRQVEVLRQKRFEETDKRFADAYQPGEILINHQKIYDIPKNTRLEIVNIDAQNNELLTRDIRTDKFRILDPLQHVKHYTAFEKKNIEIGKGDQIVFNKNDRLKNLNGQWREIQNGALGTVEKIDEKFITVKTDRDTLKFAVDPHQKGAYQFLSHGYAITPEKSQGSSIEAPVALLKGDFSGSYNLAYTTITRAEQELTIITDDPEKLLETWGAEQDKENFMELHRQHFAMNREGEKEISVKPPQKDIEMGFEPGD